MAFFVSALIKASLNLVLETTNLKVLIAQAAKNVVHYLFDRLRYPVDRIVTLVTMGVDMGVEAGIKWLESRKSKKALTQDFSNRESSG
ncbi:hypothetical protein RYX36_036447 [Vicia faba]